MIELLNGIKAPQLSADNADRIRRCRDALEAAFEALAIEAEQAGWSGDETGTALFLIAVDHMKTAKRTAEWTATSSAPTRRSWTPVHARLDRAASRSRRKLHAAECTYVAKQATSAIGEIPARAHFSRPHGRRSRQGDEGQREVLIKKSAIHGLLRRRAAPHPPAGTFSPSGRGEV